MAAPSGVVGKAGIYINSAHNPALHDMRIHEFARQSGGVDGQNGVFSTGNASGTLMLSQIEAFNNGGPNGPTHNFYINASDSDRHFTVVLRNSWSHDAVYGHTFKSRAQVNVIEANFFEGGEPNAAQGQTQAENYLLDLPNGGMATIRDNVFIKTKSGPNSNGMSITFGMEGRVDKRRQSITIAPSWQPTSSSPPSTLTCPGSSGPARIVRAFFRNFTSAGSACHFSRSCLVCQAFTSSHAFGSLLSFNNNENTQPGQAHI